MRGANNLTAHTARLAPLDESDQELLTKYGLKVVRGTGNGDSADCYTYVIVLI